MDETAQIGADLAAALPDRHDGAMQAERVALRLEELCVMLEGDPSWYAALRLATAEGLMGALQQLAERLRPIAEDPWFPS